jgi:Mg2+/Co2+ transporter CorB
LITILIGNNLVNTYTAALATTIALTMAVDMGIEQSAAIGIST